MKTTIVPAQVTTVEDKIAGNLNFTQLILIVSPIFFNGIILAFFPPMMKVTAFKFVFGCLLVVICVALAIRIKGKLLLQWIVIITRYKTRPGFYIYDKNDAILRSNDFKKIAVKTNSVIEPQQDAKIPPLGMPIAERVRLETAVINPHARFQIKVTKGGLRVYIHEIEKESLSS